MSDKDATFLIKAIKEHTKGGVKVVSGGKHMKLIYTRDSGGNKKGQAVRDENGPLIISGSPGEHRNRALAVNRLTKAGVLKFDPWDPPQGRTTGNGKPPVDREEEFEQRIARRLAVADVSRRQQEDTKALRERVEPIIVRLGGWDKRGLKSELAQTAFKFLESIDDPNNWPSVGAATQSVQFLAKGQDLSKRTRDAWSRFFQEIETSMTPRERYFELVTAAKGLTHVARREQALAQRVGADDNVERVVSPDVAAGYRVPQVDGGPFEFVSLARLHERTGLKWSMGLTIDEYAELQRAYGFMEAVILRDYGDKGAQALQTISEFLIKMGEARFYSMADRPEIDEHQ